MVYNSLFTCATIRAVHFEIVEDLSSEAFNRALIRFVSRRGVPGKVTSDNPKNLKESSKRITSLSTQILKEEKPKNSLQNMGWPGKS